MNELLRRFDETPVTAIVLMAYLTMAFATDPFHPTSAQLIAFGAARAVDIADGQPWRLLTHAFLHGGILHLVVNSYALLQLGPLVERSLGSPRFLALYIVGAIGGGIGGCFWHSPLAPLVGGSGALFAMMGALVALLARGGRDPTEFVTQPIGKRVLGMIAANLVIGFVLPMISNAAHIGGLLTGLLLTGFFLLPPRTTAQNRRAPQLALTVAFAGALVGVLLPANRWDHLLLQWDRAAPGPYRDELRAALALGDGTPAPIPDDLEMRELVDDLARARAGKN